MFRTLATRLTATYVFAAFVLVIIVGAAVTGFALSMFGITARSDANVLAREVPDEVRLQVARAGSLQAAASGIVLHLSRPGMHVALFRKDGDHTVLLAAGVPGRIDGRPNVMIFVPTEHARLPPRDPQLPDTRRFERMRPYPFGLNLVLKLEPLNVEIPGGRVTIFPDPEPLARTIDAFWLAMLPIGIGVIVLAWVLGRFITMQALRPLIETTASLNRFGAGDFTPHAIVTNDRSEIGELVKAYNAAVAQVSLAFEERTTAERNMRQFIADAGHELRTPLTVIMGFIDVLRRRSQHDGAGLPQKIFETMLFESRRMKTLIDKLIVLARLENVGFDELETVDLADLAERVVAALQGIGDRPRLTLAIEEGAVVRGYEAELHDALSNLVENAIKYAPESSALVRVRCDGDDAVVDVVDRGQGIDPADLPHVFDRFFRGRDRGGTEGFGLGLAIAKRAVERAGGEISVSSVPGGGAHFTIRIPAAHARPPVALVVSL